MALTAKPRNTLKIRIQSVKTAYLAKRIDKDEPTGKTLEYTFKSDGNRTKTKEQKEKIAGIILKNEKNKGNINETDKRTTLAQIISTFEQDKYNKGDCINISFVKSKVSFEKLKTANYGEEVYVVIHTKNMPDRLIEMNLKQGGDKKVLSKLRDAIYVTQEGSDTANILFTATVGEFAKKNKEIITNASEFTDCAIVKITLQSTNKETNKKYKKALNKANDKKANLYLAMNAEPADQNWLEVQYEEVFDNRPNLWYYGDDNWFEIRKSKIYKKGDKGNVVREINIRLAGFGGNVPTDKFTQRTENMVKQFQKDFMKIEPTGIVYEKELKAIDEFSDKNTFSFEEIKCDCGKCTGFGSEKFSSEKQKKNILEKSRKYEYPGIHRSLIYGLKAVLFYLDNTEKSLNYSFNKISSGYRCHIDNEQNDRTSTNHMGKALDIHFNKDGKRTRKVSDIEDIRSKIFKKHLGAKFDWKAGQENVFNLESTKVGATSWVHFDVREFDIEYLMNKFFIKKMKEEKIQDISN